MAYELLTGQPVVKASDLFGIIGEKHSFVLPEPHQIGPGITTDLRTFLAHGLETQPEKRTVDLSRVAQWAGPIEWPVDEGHSPT